MDVGWISEAHPPIQVFAVDALPLIHPTHGPLTRDEVMNEGGHERLEVRAEGIDTGIKAGSNMVGGTNLTYCYH